jgi:catechol 2,3-dioxygenase-like lactoylglutathione lyase family enzyme
MLGSAKLVAFVATRDGESAKRFYVDVLGLRYVSDDKFALVVEANGTVVRVSKVSQFSPQQFTVLGWEVSDIAEAVRGLQEKGVGFEKYGLPGQDELGIWTAPMVDNDSGGARVAWFKDPDGNVLSLTEFRRPS